MKLEKHLKKLQKLLRLRDWKIEVTECISIEGEGHNYIVYNDKSCEILIKSHLSDTEKLRTLIHELVHLINRDSNDIATENVGEDLKEYYIRFNERAVEQIANVIYDMYVRE